MDFKLKINFKHALNYFYMNLTSLPGGIFVTDDPLFMRLVIKCDIII